MEETTPLIFEILCIEPEENDIQTEQALIKALAYSSKLWSGNDVLEVNTKNVFGISDSKSGINLFLKTLDTSKMLTDYSDSAFIIHVEGSDLSTLEAFRIRLLRHLKTTLNFKHLRVLTDDVSTHIANQLYPKINKVESLLRRYLTKFFIQRVGVNWWDSTATRNMSEKTKMRERNDDFYSLIDEDVSLVDFDDLGELIYKQTSGFNNPEKIIEKLINLTNFEDLKMFQNELQGNYTKYFKEFFQDKYFEQRWRELFRIRNKVAHQGSFFMYDLERGMEVADALIDIISEAELNIDEVVFSLEEKESIRKATIEATYDNQLTMPTPKNDIEDDPTYFRGGLKGLKVLGKITLPMNDRYLTEDDAVAELEDAIARKYNYFVGLKWFVTTYLKNKGFVVATSYSLLNIMIDKGDIIMYDVKTNEGYIIKALKLPD